MAANSTSGKSGGSKSGSGIDVVRKQQEIAEALKKKKQAADKKRGK